MKINSTVISIFNYFNFLVLGYVKQLLTSKVHRVFLNECKAFKYILDHCSEKGPKLCFFKTHSISVTCPLQSDS